MRYGAVRCELCRTTATTTSTTASGDGYDYDYDYVVVSVVRLRLRVRRRGHRTSPTLSRLQPSSESQSIHGLRSPSALFLVFEIDATVMSSPCFCSVALHDSSCSGE